MIFFFFFLNMTAIFLYDWIYPKYDWNSPINTGFVLNITGFVLNMTGYCGYCIWVNRTRMVIMQNSVTFFSTLESKYTNYKPI